MFTPFADLTDGDLIRRIAALRRIRTSRSMGYPRYSGEITLMLAELLARGVELDEKGNRLFITVARRTDSLVRPEADGKATETPLR